MSPSASAQLRQARFRKLKRWFKGVATEIEWLVQSGHTFWELQDLVSSSTRLQEVGTNWSNHWIAANFAIGTTVRIRGIIDLDRRTSSLGRILEEVEANPAVFTRRRFLRQWSLNRGGTIEQANTIFDGFAGRAGVTVDPRRVRRDRNRLTTQLRRIKWYVDRRAAHLDRGWGRRRLRLNTIINALNELEGVTKKYYPLFMGRSVSGWFGIHRMDLWKRFFAS